MPPFFYIVTLIVTISLHCHESISPKAYQQCSLVYIIQYPNEHNILIVIDICLGVNITKVFPTLFVITCHNK